MNSMGGGGGQMNTTSNDYNNTDGGTIGGLNPIQNQVRD